jgi:nitrite reductase/ring-hydroxylating ferredoxin subunit/uncharacterized membrane protein
LHGTWLGHPLHPVLTDFTIGAWVMGAAFDLAGGLTDSQSFRRTGDHLTAAGVITAIPTAVSGLVEFSTFPEPTKKTVTWHGLLNLVNFGCYAMSVRERRRGNRARGLIFSTIGLGLTMVSAWLGGELVYRQQFGVNHADEFEGPKKWKPVLAANELPDRDPHRVDVDGKGVLLYREGDCVYAIGSVCSHAGGPLEQGRFQGSCVQCPWHDSVFDMKDGSIVHGPATHPQPHFDTRVRDGQVEIRLAEEQ